jgi:hypothetical protein
MCSHKINCLIALVLCTLIGVVLLLGSGTQGANAAQVLFIADEDNAGLLIQNESVITRLTELGHAVETVDDNLAMDVVPTGKDLIVITSSTLSTNVGFHFTEEPIPLINWENALWDELLFSIGGVTATTDVIDVIDTSHPLAGLMGLTQLGEVVVRDVASLFHLGNTDDLAPGAVVIAEEPSTGGAAIMVIDKGGQLADGSTAAATRIALFYGDESLEGVNDAGIAIFDGAVNYALGNVGGPAKLQAGDADMDLDFDQLDLVRVQVAAKYLTGQAATWGQGDWNGAPGGSPGSPPPGNGFFDQLDIIAALGPGHYLTGKYAAINKGGRPNDGQTSVVYNPATGELAVDAPAGTQLTSINIDSAARIFTGQPAQNLGGSFDNDADGNIFKATFGSSFGSLTFGNVAQSGLSEDFVANDLTVVGSLAGGGALGDVDLIYVPEPWSAPLLAVGVLVMLGLVRRRRGDGVTR